MAKKKTLETLFHEQLNDAYSAETQITEALPKMADAAGSAKLKSAFKKHLTQTQKQVERLERVCELVGCKIEEDKTCEAMEGLVAESEELLELGLPEDVLDAGLIGSAQKVEHYEIATYGTLRTFARQLGHDDAASLLEETLQEEKETDEILTTLAESSINAKAAR